MPIFANEVLKRPSGKGGKIFIKGDLSSRVDYVIRPIQRVGTGAGVLSGLGNSTSAGGGGGGGGGCCLSCKKEKRILDKKEGGGGGGGGVAPPAPLYPPLIRVLSYIHVYALPNN